MTGIHNIDLAVFDPSHRKAGSYWQWVSASLGPHWERAAEIVNQAWPAKIEKFEDQESVLYGVLDERAGGRWLYRVYPGGRDSLGRPGRYFFVLFLLKSPEQVILPEVASVLRYFDTERGLPLNTAPLDSGLTPGETDQLLRTLYERWISGDHGTHWGMDGNRRIIEFPATSPKLQSVPPKDISGTLQSYSQVMGGFERAGAASLIQRARIPLICVAIGLVVGFRLGFDLGSSRQPTTPPPLAPRLSQTPVQPLPHKPDERADPQQQTEREPAKQSQSSDADTKRDRPKSDGEN